MKPYQPQAIVVLLLALLYGCTFTQSYQPNFNDKKTTVIDSLKAKYGFEDVKFLAKKVSKGDDKHVSLTVKFINGKSMPTDTTQIKTLEKFLATEMKTIVKDPKEFDSYIILLDKMVVKGNTTNEDYFGDEFKSGEL
jgi:hypothetical protein